jgi:hypothetical protein
MFWISAHSARPLIVWTSERNLSTFQLLTELCDGGNPKKVGNIDPHAVMKVQPELMPGEIVHWAGMPNPRVIFHSDDWYAIPFSLLWGGFFIFSEGGALGYWGHSVRFANNSSFDVIWGVPFLVFGQYLIWGRFLVDAWCKRRTYYAVTDRRVLIVQEAWGRNTRSPYLSAIPEIALEGTSTGTLWLGPKLPILGAKGAPKRNMSRFYMGQRVPVLADIDDVDSVYRLIHRFAREDN